MGEGGGEEAASQLLHFVCSVSGSIRHALDSSSMKTQRQVNARKFLQKQLKRCSAASMDINNRLLQFTSAGQAAEDNDDTVSSTFDIINDHTNERTDFDAYSKKGKKRKNTTKESKKKRLLTITDNNSSCGKSTVDADLSAVDVARHGQVYTSDESEAQRLLDALFQPLMTSDSLTDTSMTSSGMPPLCRRKLPRSFFVEPHQTNTVMPEDMMLLRQQRHHKQTYSHLQTAIDNFHIQQQQQHGAQVSPPLSHQWQSSSCAVYDRETRDTTWHTHQQRHQLYSNLQERPQPHNQRQQAHVMPAVGLAPTSSILPLTMMDRRRHELTPVDLTADASAYINDGKTIGNGFWQQWPQQADVTVPSTTRSMTREYYSDTVAMLARNYSSRMDRIVSPMQGQQQCDPTNVTLTLPYSRADSEMAAKSMYSARAVNTNCDLEQLSQYSKYYDVPNFYYDHMLKAVDNRFYHTEPTDKRTFYLP